MNYRTEIFDYLADEYRKLSGEICLRHIIFHHLADMTH